MGCSYSISGVEGGQYDSDCCLHCSQYITLPILTSFECFQSLILVYLAMKECVCESSTKFRMATA